jgi:hypothetical protein
MRAPVIAFVALVACLALAACGTHRKALESKAPPQGLPAGGTSELASATLALLNRESSRMDLLTPDALAPLTEAASIAFTRTGSTRAYGLVGEFANGLLAAQVTRAEKSGFFGATSGSVPQARTTAIAGVALAHAYKVTGDPRYRSAVLAAATDVTSPALGWTAASNGDGVREPGVAQGPNIALTANAALLLERAGALGDPGLLAKARAALTTIYSSQAAVGRWYADVGGRRPMSLGEWATTLYDLIGDGSRESLGILGAGVPGIYANAFAPGGKLIKNRQTEGQPVGVALTLRAVAAWEESSLAEKAFSKLIQLRRSDGTITLARADDLVSQADFALALAQRLAGPARSE